MYYRFVLDRVFILGVPVDKVSSAQVCDLILQFTSGSQQKHIATPNSEMLVEASKNKAFKDLLNRTDLNIPDSAGLILASKFIKNPLIERVTGVDTVKKTCSKLDSKNSVFLLGAGSGAAEKAAENLKKDNPEIVIAGTYSGSPKPEDSEEIINRINECKPSILLVAYGAPAQEFWIDKYLNKMPSVRVAMGIGGTLDFIAGTVKRAPKIMRVLNLEWLFRLITQPWRFKRVWKAVVVFPFKVLTKSK